MSSLILLVLLMCFCFVILIGIGAYFVFFTGDECSGPGFSPRARYEKNKDGSCVWTGCKYDYVAAGDGNCVHAFYGDLCQGSDSNARYERNRDGSCVFTGCKPNHEIDWGGVCVSQGSGIDGSTCLPNGIKDPNGIYGVFGFKCNLTQCKSGYEKKFDSLLGEFKCVVDSDSGGSGGSGGSGCTTCEGKVPVLDPYCTNKTSESECIAVRGGQGNTRSCDWL